jgi:hypothetical protein
MTKEFLGSGDHAAMSLNANAGVGEQVNAEGYYHFVCKDKDGNMKWEEKFPNQVVQIGKQLMMDTLLKTASGYTLVGPYLGLIASSTGYSPTDTMSSHSDWTEFSNYTTGSGSAVRGTAVFASATGNNVTTPGSNIVTSSATAITYTITGAGGTVTGCFLVTGSGASSTFGSTAGTLYSAGGFSVAKVTTAGDTVTVTYSTTATS